MGIIKEYFINEKKFPEFLALSEENNILKHEDISKEFEFWIINKTYNINNPLTIEGYTAQDIKKLSPFMDGIDVFELMINLRKNPIKTKKYISCGFKRFFTTHLGTLIVARPVTGSTIIYKENDGKWDFSPRDYYQIIADTNNDEISEEEAEKIYKDNLPDEKLLDRLDSWCAHRITKR